MRCIMYPRLLTLAGITSSVFQLFSKVPSSSFFDRRTKPTNVGLKWIPIELAIFLQATATHSHTDSIKLHQQQINNNKNDGKK